MHQANIALSAGVDICQDHQVRALEGSDKVIEESFGAREHVRLVSQHYSATGETLARGFQCECDGGWMVGIVIDERHITRFPVDFQISLVAHLEASFHALKVFQCLKRGVKWDTRGM